MKDIVIVQANKGGTTVAMNKNEYITKIEEKLNDNNIYEEVKDPINLIKKKITTLTHRLFKPNRIN